MRGSLLRWAAALVALQPGLAQAQWSIRLAPEAPMYSHASVGGQSTSTSVADSFQPGIDLLGGYAVLDTLSIDLELRTGLFATGTGYSRTRTTIGPGLTLDVPTFPLYGRLAFPIQVESGTALFVRLGGGLKITDWGFFRAYFEVTLDLACAGNGLSFFGSQTVNAGLGIWFRL